MIGVEFGFLEEATILRWSAGSIEPLPEHAEIIAGIRGHERVYSGWRYSSLAPVVRDSKEEKTPPAMPTKFTLPATHRLILKDAHLSEDAEDFYIALFGLLKGLRLQRDGWQHFYSSPIKRGTLCDFYADDREIEQALDIATRTWCSLPSDNVRKQVFGSLHWHLFAQLYEHDFERFSAQYTALDACSKLAVELPQIDRYNDQPSHAQRAEKLCSALGIPVPGWAKCQQNKNTLAERRNALVHEARYAGEPVGFAVPMENLNMTLELTGLVARIYLRLLGIENEYTRSRCTVRQTMGFTFEQQSVLTQND